MLASRPSITSRRHRQRGAALLTAMIIVTLVATLAASMVWQQWRAVQVETAERARTQAAWILSGARDFAKLILKETAKRTSTALTDPWATPLAEARLSTFLAVDKSNADDGPEAFLSGYITDAQSRYNLNNLLVPAADNKLPNQAELVFLDRLCQTAGVDASVAARIATGLRDASAGASAAAPLEPLTVQQLTWFGIDAASVKALEPYVALLPRSAGRTQLNINTASREVLTAVVGAGPAGQIVTTRASSPYKDMTSLSIPETTKANLAVASNYFDVYGRLRLVDRVLVERSLLQRNQSNGQFSVLHSERVASLDQVGAQPAR